MGMLLEMTLPWTRILLTLMMPFLHLTLPLANLELIPSLLIKMGSWWMSLVFQNYLLKLSFVIINESPPPFSAVVLKSYLKLLLYSGQLLKTGDLELYTLGIIHIITINMLTNQHDNIPVII